jgi:SAM-dependent methyltransferase
MSGEPPSKQAQLDKVLGYILGNQAAWIADIGLRAGFFSTFAEAGGESLGEEALARRFGYALRPVQVWCHSAYAYGFLDWEEGAGYRMAPHMLAILLDSADPSCLGGRIHFYTALNEDYRSYPDFLRLGETSPRCGEDPWLLAALQNLTKPDALMITDHVLPQSPAALARLEGGGGLLDVGAGEGDHVIHYARRFPIAHVVGLEIDPAKADAALQKVAREGLSDRVKIRQGDAGQLDEENIFDLVTMNLTFHDLGGPEEQQSVLARMFRALKPGGTLLVSEIPYPDSIQDYRRDPSCQLLTGVQIHLTMKGCSLIPQSELCRLILEAQFTHVRIARQPVPTRLVVLGEKPDPFAG